MIWLKVLRLWPEAERREMSTKKISSIRHDYNPTVDKLLQDHEHGRLTDRLSNFMTRPAYAYTSMEQRQIFERPMCEPCGYYRENEQNKLECQFPWFDPEDYDLAAYDYLPCKEGLTYEED